MKNILLLFLFTLSFCTSQKDLSKLTVALSIEPISLTPFESNDIPSYRVRWQIFDRLVTMDKKGNILPSLAIAWTNIDDMTLQLTLRSNVVFHNGQLFTAKDAKYSIEQAIKTPTLSTVLGVIKSADIINDYTINVKLSVPYAPALAVLSHSGFLMTPKNIIREKGETPIIGTGPFKLETWNRGQSITLTRNDNYWGNIPKIESIQFLVVPDASVRSIIVETGEADIAYDIDGSEKERLLQDTTVQYLETPFPTVHYLGFNTTRAPYNNKLFRQAIAEVIDYQGIINSVAFGSGELAVSLLHSSIFGSYNQFPIRKRNLEKAKTLLKESGVKLDNVIPMYTIEGPRKKMAEIIQANLKEIGLIIDVQVLEWGTMLDFARKGNLDTFILGWTSIPADADIGLYSLTYSKNFGSGGNYSFYNNNRVDVLLENAREERNMQQRKDLYKEIQEILYEELPLIPLYHPYNNAVISKDIKGFELDLFSVHELKTVYR